MTDYCSYDSGRLTMIELLRNKVPFPKQMCLLEYLQTAMLSSNTLGEDSDTFQYINFFRQRNIEQDIFLSFFIK